MKAMKRIALVLAAVMVLAVASVAFAVGSSSGTTTYYTPTYAVTPVTTGPVSAADAAQLQNAAADHVAKVYGSQYQVQELSTFDISNATGWITLNVAGARVGDRILVIHKLANGSIEILNATVLANGVVSFHLGSNSPISIVRVVDASAVDATTMYKTGDATSAAAMVLLAVVCGAVMMTCGKALKN